MPRLSDVPHLRFLTIEEMSFQLAGLQYRPGWNLSIFADPWEGPCLYILADVPDAFDADKTTELRVRVNIPPMPSVQYFEIWLAWRLQLMESHESREFLRRVSGDPLFNPHDPYEPGGREWPPPVEANS